VDTLADLVLHNDGNSNFGDVPVFGGFYLKRKMVSVLFCDGENLGQMHFVRFGILL
jgi:hypothetical protein